LNGKKERLLKPDKNTIEDDYDFDLKSEDCEIEDLEKSVVMISNVCPSRDLSFHGLSNVQ
jgi:hypothetical protein